MCHGRSLTSARFRASEIWTKAIQIKTIKHHVWCQSPRQQIVRWVDPACLHKSAQEPLQACPPQAAAPVQCLFPPVCVYRRYQRHKSIVVTPQNKHGHATEPHKQPIQMWIKTPVHISAGQRFHVIFVSVKRLTRQSVES
jgi:hypothetical protein